MDDLPLPPALFENHIAQQPGHAGHQRIAQPVLHGDAEEHLERGGQAFGKWNGGKHAKSGA